MPEYFLLNLKSADFMALYQTTLEFSESVGNFVELQHLTSILASTSCANQWMTEAGKYRIPKLRYSN